MAVTARGVAYGTSPSPTIADSKTTDGTGTGSFTSSLTGLNPNKTYYVRAYATTAAGTAYGAEVSFLTQQAALNISYPSVPVTVTAGSVMTPVTLTSTGGTPDKVQVNSLAGGNSMTYFADGLGTSARFRSPTGVAVDGSGNLYVSDQANNRIRKIVLSTGAVTTLAGSGAMTPFADGTGALATFTSPYGVATDGSGNVYVAEYNHRIRKITPEGSVTTFAGSGSTIPFADGTGAFATFNYPKGVAVDGSGSVYVGYEENNRIRKITSRGVVTTLAGTDSSIQFTNGAGNVATFNRPLGVAVDASGNVFVADRLNHRIRKITSGGVVTTLAGGGSIGNSFGSTDGIGTAALFLRPSGVAVDALGNVYVADKDNHRIRKITSDGVVTTLAGSGSWGSFGNGTGTDARFSSPSGIAVDGSGNLYVADEKNNAIRLISSYRIVPDLPDGLFFDARTGTISGTPTRAQAARVYTVHARNSQGSTTAPITLSVVGPPTVTTTDATRVTAATATLNGTVNPNGGTTTALTFTYSTKSDLSEGTTINPTPTSSCQLCNSSTTVSADISVLTAGTTYYFRLSAANAVGTSNGTTLLFTTAAAAPSISYSGSPITLSVGTAMTSLAPVNVGGDPEPMQVSTLAGGGSMGAFADGTGTAARFNLPTGVATDVSGNVYVADQRNNRIRMITSAGVVTTLAGGGSLGSYADGTGTSARFSSPNGVAMDVSGNVYVSDYGNHRIRKITSAGVVSTLAGNNSSTFADGIGTAASIKNPNGVSVDGSGNIYVGDGNHRIRKITSGGVVTTLAGGGSTDAFADGTGTAARFSNPSGIALDASGNVYVADLSNQRIRKITSAGVVTTLAGAPAEVSPTALARVPCSRIPSVSRWTATETFMWRIRTITVSARSPTIPSPPHFRPASPSTQLPVQSPARRQR